MIDRGFIGHEQPPASIEVEKYPLKLFAKAIGETGAVYVDEDAARKAGYRSLLAPPTYVLCLYTMAMPDGMQMIHELGINPASFLHGEQKFAYHAPICAGDHLDFRTRIGDIYEKKGGALEFVVTETAVSNQDGTHVADLSGVIVVRN